jgi:hypothetical protein
MNHKRHNPTKKADSDIMGSWSGGTLPAKKRLSPVPDEVKRTPSKKPKDYCIKLKGVHIYPVGYGRHITFNEAWKVVRVKRRCMRCGKKEDWWIEL